MAIPIELVIFAFGLGLVIIGNITTKLNIMKMMGAILLIVLTVVIFSDGINTLDNLTTTALASVSFGIGVISLITDNFSKEGEGEPDTEEVDEDDGRFHD